ncbi:hypothetical protein [Tabrizicola sp.]|uniref:hypothetical protein n=1 Tax=Tabrizicola sp. TaxID=2005166 RepID=UPI003F3F9439
MISGFDSKLIALIESHPSIIVGTCDRALVPTMSRGYGARVIDGGEAVEVLISRWPGRQTLANIEATGQIAVTFTTPETYDAYQIKGKAVSWGDCTAADLELSAVFTAVIRKRIRGLGESEGLVRVIFASRGLYRVRLVPEAVFLQTPGKNAGQRL